MTEPQGARSGSLLFAGIALVAIVITAALVSQQKPAPRTGGAESASPPPATMPGSTPATTPGSTPPAIGYSCGGPAFSPDIFDEPDFDLSSLPAGVALAEFIESGQDGEEILPKRGHWHVVGADDATASFVAAVPGDPPYVDARVAKDGGAWRVVGWGQCRPRVAFEGTGAATWVLGSENVEPSATSFVAAVTEMACASGRSSEGRVNEPMILYRPDAVVVIFTVDPLPGGQNCPSNPPTRVKVELSEPLGDRKLLDGGMYPWGDPTRPGPWH